MANKNDWSANDLEAVADDGLAATSYKIACETEKYDADYTTWQVADHDGLVRAVNARDYYRLAWRGMAANGNERTLIAAVIPPALRISTEYSVFARPPPNSSSRSARRNHKLARR